jgi:hypothetical protein
VVSLPFTAFLYAVRSPATPTEALLKRLVWWGACLLIVGVLLDPVVGGTRKEPPTAAWMFQSTSVAIFVLASLILVMNVLEKPRWMRLLVDSGQNPMIAYVGYGTLILPLIGLTGVKHAIESREPTPWVAFSWSVLVTLMVAYVTAFFTRRRVFWRT